MNNKAFLSTIESISLERGIDKEQILLDVESAIAQAARKRFDQYGDFTVSIDRETGEIRAYEDSEPVDLEDLGRIVANVCKQIFTQRLREDERDIHYDQYVDRVRTIISGTIQRIERNSVIVKLGNRVEAILPRDERIPGENYRPGATVRALLLKVEKRGQRVRMILSRTHTEFVRQLFEAEVPEIGDGLIEVKGLVREPGRRTKIAVFATEARIDPVGSCVGMRGSRITKISDELGGEKIDIIPWDENPAQYIINSLKPASILSCSYDAFRDRARVIVSQDQLPLAIGKAGQNVRLSARLTGYRIDVLSEEQQQQSRAEGSAALQGLIDSGLLEDFGREILLDNHITTLSVLSAQTPETLMDNVEELQLGEAALQALIDKANELLSTDEERAERDEFIRIREEGDDTYSENEESEEANSESIA